jgi:hypothetical protein
MTYTGEIIAFLDSLQWINLNETFEEIADRLRKINNERQFIRKEFESLDDNEMSRRISLSHETSTHYKWFVHKNNSLGYSIWIHEYKTQSARRFGYAEVPHNHRYWFSSLILRGGFENQLFAVTPSAPVETFQDLQLIQTDHHEKGSVYIVNPDTIHSINHLQDPTWTLLIRSRGVRLFSDAFDPNTKSVTHHYPFSSRVGIFKRTMSSI